MTEKNVHETRYDAVICVKDMAEFIGETIQNLLDCNIPPQTIFVIDDGSSDNSANVARGFPKTKVVENGENRGKPYSRNLGIEMSTAPFIQLIDADDLLHPAKTEIQLSYLNKHPETDAVWGDMDYFHVDKNGEKVLRGLRTYENVDDLLLQLLEINVIGLHSYFFRKSYFEKAGLFDHRFVTSQDRELWIRALLNGCKVEYTQGAICYYRRHEKSTIASQQKEAAYYNALAVRVHHKALKNFKKGKYSDVTSSTLRMLARNANRFLRDFSEVSDIIDEADVVGGEISINQNQLYQLSDKLWGFKMTERLLRPKFWLDHKLGRYRVKY
jgi:glycosyltransferase involved in cell wall biosynthesis